MMRGVILFLIILANLIPETQAKTSMRCDHYHTIAPGDSLSMIAKEAYGEMRQWPLIYHSNSNVLHHGPNHLEIGQRLYIPCLEVNGNLTKPQAENDRRIPADHHKLAKLRLLTGSDYRPFTDQNWPSGGMITELIQEIFTFDYQPNMFEIMWVNDWESHLNPLLIEHLFDAGFPWIKPNCNEANILSKDMQFRCTHFLFSEPIFDMLVVFYTRVKSSLPLKQHKQLYGKKICRPKGYFTFDLEEKNLIHRKTITLKQPSTIDDCFRLLHRGEVDAVSVNEMTGSDKLRKMNLHKEIVSRIELTSEQGLHLVIARAHPEAHEILERFNRGLKRLRSSDRYDKIIARHLTRFYRLRELNKASP